MNRNAVLQQFEPAFMVKTMNAQTDVTEQSRNLMKYLLTHKYRVLKVGLLGGKLDFHPLSAYIADSHVLGVRLNKRLMWQHGNTRVSVSVLAVSPDVHKLTPSIPQGGVMQLIYVN